MKLRSVFAVLILSIFAFNFLGCGPDKSQSDELEDQSREDFEKVKARLAPAIGTYKGLIVNREKAKNEALFIISHNILTKENGRDVTPIASLGGLIVMLKLDPDGKNIEFPPWEMGSYDPGTHRIFLVGKSLTLPGNVTFVGELNGDILTGDLRTPGENGQGMSFEGVRQPAD